MDKLTFDYLLLRFPRLDHKAKLALKAIMIDKITINQASELFGLSRQSISKNKNRMLQEYRLLTLYLSAKENR